MFTTTRSRVGAAALLSVLLFVLAVWYGSLAPAPELGAYPEQEHLDENDDRYVGDRVVVSGRVVDTSPVTIVSTYGAGETVRLTVTDLPTSVSEGETLRVYGVAESDRAVRALSAFTVPPSGYGYAWIVSFLAGLWVLARLVRHWRLDTTDWALEPRETPLTLGAVERIRRTTVRSAEDENA